MAVGLGAPLVLLLFGCEDRGAEVAEALLAAAEEKAPFGPIGTPPRMARCAMTRWPLLDPLVEANVRVMAFVLLS